MSRSLVVMRQVLVIAATLLLGACGGSVDATGEDSGTGDGAGADAPSTRDATVIDARDDSTVMADSPASDGPGPKEAGPADAAPDATAEGGPDAAADGGIDAAADATPCPPGLVLCDAGCIDPLDDPSYCGATAGCGIDGGTAGTSCVDDCAFCVGGACQVSCSAGLVVCDGTCVDPRTSSQHCGATCSCVEAGAGTVCLPPAVCVSGMCTDG